MLHKALLSSPKEFRVSIASRNRPADRKTCVFFTWSALGLLILRRTPVERSKQETA